MLSQIAPVVAYPTVAWSTDWREMTITNAKAMGMEAEGQKLVEAMVENENLLEALQADPLFAEIPAVKNGAVLLLDPTTDLSAAATPSILSIPATLDEYLSLLQEAAVKGNE